MLPSGTEEVFRAVDLDSNENVPSYKFHPKKKDRIYAKKDDAGFFFTSAGRRQFQWIGYLKIPFANRELEKLSQMKFRQGVDEYEWLRKKAQ